MDDFRNSLKKLLEQWNRLRPEKNFNHELEFRIGRFSAQNTFVPGIQTDEKDAITNLRQCLAKEVLSSPNRWIDVPEILAVRSYHAQNIRRTIIRSQKGDENKEIIERKININQMDIRTDRPLHVRASICKEEHLTYHPNSPEYISFKQNVSVANAVSVLHRKSFLEKLEHSHYGPVVFRYDITKSAPRASNKKECANLPCQYHIELELESVSSPLTESDHIHYVMELIIVRLQFLLGTHQVSTTPNTPPQALPPATLRIVS